jgi:hypothetical protein
MSHEFTREPWNGEGFRHYHDPALNIICPRISQSCRVRFRSPDESLRLSLGRGRRNAKHPLAGTNGIAVVPDPILAYNQ